MDSSTRVQNDNERPVLKVNNDGRVCKRESTIPHCHSERSEESILIAFKKQKD
jgi:hypothetical protein